MEQDLLYNSGEFLSQEEKLKSKDLPATQEMLVSVRNELKSDIAALSIKLTSSNNELKNEMNGLSTELRGEMNSLRTELKDEMNGLRSELRGEMNSLRTELKGEMSGLRTELKNEMSVFRTELKTELKAEFKKEFEKIQFTLESTTAELKALYHRAVGLHEEQNNKFNYLLDKYNLVTDWQQYMETRVKNVEDFVDVLNK